MHGSAWDRIATGAARVAWPIVRTVARAIPSHRFHPAWAPGRLLKSVERSKPALGWPRVTDSLCPTCVRAARRRILNGEQDVQTLATEHVGEIKAHLRESEVQWLARTG